MDSTSLKELILLSVITNDNCLKYQKGDGTSEEEILEGFIETFLQVLYITFQFDLQIVIFHLLKFFSMEILYVLRNALQTVKFSHFP